MTRLPKVGTKRAKVLRYKKARPVSLRIRLIISIGLALIASLALGGALSFWNAGRQVQTEMQAAIAVGAHVVQTAIDDSNQLGADRRRRWERLIAEFDGDRHLQAFLVNRDNQIVLASTPKSPDTSVPRWFHRLLGGDSQVMRVKLPAESEDYSGVVLATDASNELSEAWSDIGLALATLATFCTLVLGLVYWTLAKGLRPLQDLNVAFARVGRGDYGPRVAESGSLELACLGREFNQMVARLSTMKLQNDRLNEQLTNVEEQHRASLAQELHDEVGPFLFAVSLDVSSIHQIIGDDEALQLSLVPRLEAIRDAVAHMQKHLKIILGRLRPAVLLDLGLAPAVDNIIEFWKRRHPDIVFHFHVYPESFGKVMDDGIYRIVRESLSNALRHGHPSRIDVNIELEADKMVTITVVDDGGGITASGSMIGFGIVGMQERAASLGGVLMVRNRPDGKGVIVKAQLPIPGTSDTSTEQVEEKLAS